MRVLPILTALLVMAALYFLVIERDTVLALAGDEPATQTSADDATAAPKDEPEPAVSVVALRSEAQMIDTGVTLRGRTEALRLVDVRAETSARVVSEPRRKGAYVKKGELLCHLDPDTREADLAEAEARLEEARINQRAASQLVERGFTSETGKAAADAALRSAQAQVDRARLELERLEIRAPFAGHLESDTAEIGALLQPGGLCATVIQLDPIRLVGFVPETEVQRVETGARAGARLATGERVEGRVTFLSRSADPTTRTFRVDMEVPNADFAIRDGQTADIVIQTEGQKAHKLPASALTLNDAGDLGVRLVAEGDRVRFAPVTLDRDTDSGIFVTGLPDTAAVIVVGQEYVTEGSRVEVTWRESGS
ncbi:efflux RND transporter periplasmic adaptor subunit [Maritimibacter sp. 55A14]|uniref:efflux RND transporter periplasmic adaptor subunit n=1 Tax=Maritimibacter sp. 55A14 TaxID=2174844 RepID=UPI000D61F7E4|nr:efflux RND transporter periplasmic adaptor subunit [Maritimibacter sp. 55A14]PWE33903.1 efflux RND transporter periplasmic adaptor subunit [Maritimibacter sp. 55A14]